MSSYVATYSRQPNLALATMFLAVTCEHGRTRRGVPILIELISERCDTTFDAHDLSSGSNYTWASLRTLPSAANERDE
eukprot:scaffold4495_cov79-Skeletonema_marinoi.AAC.2